MELQSLKEFNQLSNSIQGRRKELSEDAEKFQRQLAFFHAEMERNISLNDTESIAKTEQAIYLITMKLNDVEKELEGLHLAPLAELVYQECEEKITELRQLVGDQWQKAIDARVNFLIELEKLGELRRASQDLSGQVGGAFHVLRRNAPDPIGFSGQHNLQVLLPQINSLLKT
jgi:hypothetical protein